MEAAHLQNKGVDCLHFVAPAVNCVLYDLRYRTLSAIAKQWPVRRVFKVCRGIQALVLACSGQAVMRVCSPMADYSEEFLRLKVHD